MSYFNIFYFLNYNNYLSKYIFKTNEQILKEMDWDSKSAISNNLDVKSSYIVNEQRKAKIRKKEY